MENNLKMNFRSVYVPDALKSTIRLFFFIIFFFFLVDWKQKANHRKCKHQSTKMMVYENATLFFHSLSPEKIERGEKKCIPVEIKIYREIVTFQNLSIKYLINYCIYVHYIDEYTQNKYFSGIHCMKHISK